MKKISKIRVIAIVGPTACGKTKLSIELAKRLNGEIVSADSMQIYKTMDIGTAKPSRKEMQEVPHHLIDFLDIDKEFSVADYVRLARNCIFEINNRGKVPFVVGGTGLYVDSLLNNIDFVEQEPDLELRKILNKRIETEGAECLLKELKTFDEKSANNIHPNNKIRIIRAIEIYKTTGITMTEHIENYKKKKSIYDTIFIGLTYQNRNLMYENINKRVDRMIKLGLVEEAKKILHSNASKTAMNAICYKELIPYFNNQCSLDEAVENLKRKTRKYAKRQLTWFRKNNKINWFFIDEYINFKEILNFCIKNIERKICM